MIQMKTWRGINYFLLTGAVVAGAATSTLADEPLRNAAKAGNELNPAVQSTTQAASATCAVNPGPVRTILDLPRDSIIPQEIYRKHDARAIGASIVERLRRGPKCRFDQQIKQDPRGSRVVDFGRDYLIHLAFDEQHLESIRDRCFLNQHQVGHSNGSLWQSRRQEREDEMTGLRLEKEYNSDPKVHHVRPKYAYYTPTRTVLNHQYGNVHAVLKNAVKNEQRSCWATRLSMSVPWSPAPRTSRARFLINTGRKRKFGATCA